MCLESCPSQECDSQGSHKGYNQNSTPIFTAPRRRLQSILYTKCIKGRANECNINEEGGSLYVSPDFQVVGYSEKAA